MEKKKHAPVATFKIGAQEQPILRPRTDGAGWELCVSLGDVNLAKKELVDQLRQKPDFTIHLCKEPKVGVLRDPQGKILCSIKSKESIEKIKKDIKNKIKRVDPTLTDETIDSMLKNISRRKLLILREISNPFSPVDPRDVCELAGLTPEKFEKWLRRDINASRIRVLLNKYHTEHDLRPLFLKKMYEGLSRKNKDGEPVWDAQTTALLRIVAEGLGWGAKQEPVPTAEAAASKMVRQATQEMQLSWSPRDWESWGEIVRKCAQIFKASKKQLHQTN